MIIRIYLELINRYLRFLSKIIRHPFKIFCMLSNQKTPGLLVIISSPSGGGKDSVISALLKLFPRSTRFITTTSRPPRPGNRDGVDYYFISNEEFQRRIENQEFLEWNFYAGNYYGTEKRHLENLQSRFDLVLTQIEVNGKHHLDQAGVPNLSIFLLPESLDTLGARISKRGGVTPEALAERLAIAKQEIAASSDYDYCVANREGALAETVTKVSEIIKEHLEKQAGIDKPSQSG